MALSKTRITKALIRLRGCAGWSVPVLFANPGRQVFSRRGPYKEGIYNLSVIAPIVFGFCVVSSFAIVLPRKRELFRYFICVVAVCVLCLLVMALFVGLQSVTVALPLHTYLLFHCQHKFHLLVSYVVYKDC